MWFQITLWIHVWAICTVDPMWCGFFVQWCTNTEFLCRLFIEMHRFQFLRTIKSSENLIKLKWACCIYLFNKQIGLYIDHCITIFSQIKINYYNEKYGIECKLEDTASSSFTLVKQTYWQFLKNRAYLEYNN